MTKKYKSVSGMIQHLSTDENFKNLAEKEIREKQLSKLLFFLRNQQKLSQKEMAQRTGYSQSKISKIESSRDIDLSMKDLLAYAKALKLQLEIGYRNPNQKLVDDIKHHAFKMIAGLEQLCSLAKDDPEMVEGVRKFHAEALMNVLSLISASYQKLPAKEKSKKEETLPLHVSTPPLSPLAKV